MKGWELKSLDSFGELTSSKRIYLSDYVSEGVPFYRSKEIIEKSEGKDISTPLFIDEKKFYEIKDKFGAPTTGDILITAVGTLGVIYRVKESDFFYFKDGNLIWLRKIKKHINSSFLFHLLNSKIGKAWLDETSIGSSQPAYTIANLKKIKVPIPPKSIQQNIAAVLSAYDDLIENNKRRIALLENMAEEIYREWFVRLRFPGHEKVKVVKGVPIDWDYNRASTFFSVIKGKSYGGDEVTENPSHMPFITLKSFNRGGGYREDGLKYYSGRCKDDQIVHKDDIVMAVTDMTQNREVVGRVAKVPDFGEKGAVISLDVIKVVPKKTAGAFLYSYLRFSGFAECIKEFANGANVLHLKPDLVPQQKINIPPMPLQLAFSEIVKPIYDQIDLLSVSIKRMTETRDMLLPRLISGKLSVENLDIQFPPSMLNEIIGS
jgi:type I restriction enzyme S subunit